MEASTLAAAVGHPEATAVQVVHSEGCCILAGIIMAAAAARLVGVAVVLGEVTARPAEVQEEVLAAGWQWDPAAVPAA